MICNNRVYLSAASSYIVYVYWSVNLLGRKVGVEDVRVQVPLAIHSLPDHDVPDKEEHNCDSHTWSCIHAHDLYILLHCGKGRHEHNQCILSQNCKL